MQLEDPCRQTKCFPRAWSSLVCRHQCTESETIAVSFPRGLLCLTAGHWGLRGELVVVLQVHNPGGFLEKISTRVVHTEGRECQQNLVLLSGINYSSCEYSLSNVIHSTPCAVQAYNQVLGPLASTEAQNLTRYIKYHYI